MHFAWIRHPEVGISQTGPKSASRDYSDKPFDLIGAVLARETASLEAP